MTSHFQMNPDVEVGTHYCRVEQLDLFFAEHFNLTGRTLRFSF